MESTNLFTLGSPVFSFLQLPPKGARHSGRNASPHTWIRSSSHVPNHFFFPSLFLFLIFFSCERGVFFFRHHYPGNLIHTEYNGEERGRLDRRLEEIMKFVHIQASWKVPPLPPVSLSKLPQPQSRFSLQTAPPAFPPPTAQKKEE